MKKNKDGLIIIHATYPESEQEEGQGWACELLLKLPDGREIKTSAFNIRLSDGKYLIMTINRKWKKDGADNQPQFILFQSDTIESNYYEDVQVVAKKAGISLPEEEIIDAAKEYHRDYSHKEKTKKNKKRR